MCIKYTSILTENLKNLILKKEIRMKQRELIKKLQEIGFTFKRHGGNHDIYSRGSEEEQIPRHREINEKLAKAILKKWGL